MSLDRRGSLSSLVTPPFGFTVATPGLRPSPTDAPTSMPWAFEAEVEVPDSAPWFPVDHLWDALAASEPLRHALSTIAVQARALAAIADAQRLGVVALPAELQQLLDEALTASPVLSTHQRIA